MSLCISLTIDSIFILFLLHILNHPNNFLYNRVETIEGTAESGKDYEPVKTTMVFEKDEVYKFIEIEIIDDNEWEPDEIFFVKMLLDIDDPGYKHSLIGKHSIVEITIINDDGKCFKSDIFSFTNKKT